ncbi:MAG: TM2 domain-containing protein [Clostridia bacterium]|nr:TM2 domain-containing protein [Clostridia bacterium]
MSEKSWILTLLLCIFFGYLGIHRFYAGKIWTGLLYLFTGGLFGLGYVIDFIIICVGAFDDKQKRAIRP